MKVLLLILTLALAVCAQVSPRFDESSARATVEGTRVSVTANIENDGPPTNAVVWLDLLDADDAVVGNGATPVRLSKGVTTIVAGVVGSNPRAAIEPSWRVRWTVTSTGAAPPASGIVALSSLIGEPFQIKVVAPEAIVAGQGFSVQVTAIGVLTGQPVADVLVDARLDVNRPVSGKTNNDGFVSLKLPPFNGEYLPGLSVTGAKNGQTGSATAWLELVRRNTAAVVTIDKSLYQPGQTVRARGVLLGPDGKVVADRDVTFAVLAGGVEKVAELTAKTSRFGVASVEWPIPAAGKTGGYAIAFLDGEEKVGSAKFSVSRYEMPSFSIGATPLKPFVLAAERVAAVRIDAAYVFGKPLAGAPVVVGRENSGDAAAEGVTGADGSFIARLDLADEAAVFADAPTKNYIDAKFTATVTDPDSGRGERRRFVVRVSRGPIHLYVRQPLRSVSPDIPYELDVAAFYPDGTPCRCDVRFEGNFEDTTLVANLGETRTNRYGAGRVEIRFPHVLYDESSLEFRLRAIVDDGAGKTIEQTMSVEVDADADALELRTDKTIYRPGEPVFVELYSTKTEALAIVEIANEKNSVLTREVRISKGRGRVTIPYRDDFAGQFRVGGWIMDDEFDATAARSIIFPRRSGLKLDIGSLRKTYSPDEEAKATFEVTAADDSPVGAALGVFVIDRGIEERAAADGLPNNLDAVRGKTIAGRGFGALTGIDFDDIDTTSPIDADLQLAARELLPFSPPTPTRFGSNAGPRDVVRRLRGLLEKRAAPLRDFYFKLEDDTGDVPRNDADAGAMLRAGGRKLDEFRDPWGVPFKLTVGEMDARRSLTISTAGPDKQFGTADDDEVYEVYQNWFERTRRRLQAISDGQPAPETVEQIMALWKSKGFDVDSLRDSAGVPLRIRRVDYRRDLVKTSVRTIGRVGDEYQQMVRTEPVRQTVRQFLFERVDAAKTAITPFGGVVFVIDETSLRPPVEEVVLTTEPLTSAPGAVAGTVFDGNDAVIQGASVELGRVGSGEKTTIATDDEGRFRFTVVQPGRFQITVRKLGFKALILSELRVIPGNVVRLKIKLDVAELQETVTVDGADATLEMTVSKMVRQSEPPATATVPDGASQAMFTPRVRQYFPETLVWRPELLTGGNGRAELPFRLADTLSTWKLYAIASTADGRFALAEREFSTFQPFIAELEPPRVLTVGDRIEMPVTVRNYTDEKQSVSAKLNADWARPLDSGTARLEIPANDAARTTFGFEAVTPVVDGAQRLTASSRKTGDAIEKPVTVVPYGRETTIADANFDAVSNAMKVTIPADALAGSRTGVVRIFPSALAEFAGALDKLLERPHGCGEQTTSSTYPNLLVLRTARDLGLTLRPSLSGAARKNLDDGYRRLLGYRTPSGGFAYWGVDGSPDLKLTAYVVRFLRDARDFTTVDEAVVRDAERWLRDSQDADGSWGTSASTTAMILQSLAEEKLSDENRRAIEKGLGYLRDSLDNESDSALVARFAIAADLSGDHAGARKAAEILRRTVRKENSQGYWFSGSTPFGGWGLPAALEATALSAKAFMIRHSFEPKPEYLEIAKSAADFLNRRRDFGGIWYSTQTTIVVLDALAAMRSGAKKGETARGEIVVNGVKAGEFSFDGDVRETFELDVSKFLTSGENRVELESKGASAILPAQFSARYFIDWKQIRNDERYFKLSVGFDKPKAARGETVTASLTAERIGRNWGMVVAEVGLPPGAEVDKTRLDAAVREKSISSYEVRPDRVVIYSWMTGGKLRLAFGFRPRFAMTASSTPSSIYDYYNDEARAVVAPTAFEIAASANSSK